MRPPAVVQRRVLVSGRVQGVSFRASTRREALRYPSIRGFVRNLPDGRVEAVFQGDEIEVQALVEWCSHGPKLAHVTALEVFEEAVSSDLPPFYIA